MNLFLENTSPTMKLSPYALGKLRIEIKKHLVKELGKVDKSVKQLLK